LVLNNCARKCKAAANERKDSPTTVYSDDWLRVRDGTVKLTKSLRQLKIPLTVQAILSLRIDRLPPDQKELAADTGADRTGVYVWKAVYVCAIE